MIRKLGLYNTMLSLMAVLLASVAFAGVPIGNKTDICHFDKDTGIWKLISVGNPAVNAHFKNHDDGFPGNTTTKSGTELDGNCEPEVGPCGNCLEAHGGLGCENQACQDIVCGTDPFCCDVSWDGICAGEAANLCDCE